MSNEQATTQAPITTPKSEMNFLTELAVEVDIPIRPVFISLSVPADFFKADTSKNPA